MPYKVKKSGSGYKVCKKKGGKCFSKKSLPKSKALAQMRAIIANESLSFGEYFFLCEKILNYGNKETGRGYIEIKAPKGYDVFSLKTLVGIIKEIIKDPMPLWNFIKQKSYNFSPLIILLSILVAMGETQLFIDKNPEILKKDPQIIQKAAKFLDSHPEILNLIKR